MVVPLVRLVYESHKIPDRGFFHHALCWTRERVQSMSLKERGSMLTPQIRILILLILTAQPAWGSDHEDHAFLYEFLAGRYLVIGKAVNSEETYSGTVDFSCKNGRIAVVRTIQGAVVHGEGTLEHALGQDKADVLRVRFNQAGKKYEITYLWRSDLDNYARLSGYVYQPGQQTGSPGMEALFIDHSQR